MRRTPQHALLLVSILAVALGVLACSAGASAYRKGREAAQRGERDAAVVFYTRAVNEDPSNIEYRLGLERALLDAGA